MEQQNRELMITTRLKNNKLLQTNLNIWQSANLDEVFWEAFQNNRMSCRGSRVSVLSTTLENSSFKGAQFEKQALGSVGMWAPDSESYTCHPAERWHIEFLGNCYALRWHNMFEIPPRWNILPRLLREIPKPDTTDNL